MSGNTTNSAPHSEDRELNQAGSKPNQVDLILLVPLCTNIMVHNTG